MKLYIITLATICLTFSRSHCQSELNRPTQKNEIGIHIGGVLKSVVSGFYQRSVQQPWGITYKRVNGNWATRIGFTHQLNRFPEEQLGGSLILPNGKYETRSTDVHTRQNIFRLGREYRIPLKYNIQLVLGADIQARNFLWVRSLHSNVAEIDTVLYIGTTVQDISYANVTSTRIHFSELSGWQYGIGLSCGVMIPLGNRLVLNGNVRLDSFYGIVDDTNYDYLANSFERTRTSLRSLNTIGPLSELSLFYRF